MGLRQKAFTLLIALCGLFGAASAMFVGKHAILRLKIAFAEDQIRMIEELKNTALNSEQPERYLQAIAKYYPSGTKQAAGSKLDFIVETVRSNALREVTAHLSRKGAQHGGGY